MDFCGAVVYEQTGSNSSSSFCVEKDEDGHWRRLDMHFDPELCPNNNRAMQKRECYVIKSQEEEEKRSRTNFSHLIGRFWPLTDSG